MIMKRLLLLVLFVNLYCISSAQSSGTLKVEVVDLRSNIGKVGIRIFTQPKGFPTNREKAMKELFSKPISGIAVFEIENLAYGTYAIGSIHDENENKDFDTNFIGYPKEGFGTSNNMKSLLGPPSFNDAKFTFAKEVQGLTIQMIYY